MGVVNLSEYSGKAFYNKKYVADTGVIPKRGKEREIPKVKKPSPLKKVNIIRKCSRYNWIRIALIFLINFPRN